MGWVLLAVAAAAVAGAASILRGGRACRHAGAATYTQRSRAEGSERPHQQVAHYRASGALPRWDP